MVAIHPDAFLAQSFQPTVTFHRVRQPQPHHTFAQNRITQITKQINPRTKLQLPAIE